MTRIVTVLTEGFADWETTLINAAGRSFYGFETVYATPGGQPVRSSGGMRVAADLAIEDIDPNGLDVLLVCGGGIWETDAAPDVTDLLRRTHAAGKIVGEACAEERQRVPKSGAAIIFVGIARHSEFGMVTILLASACVVAGREDMAVRRGTEPRILIGGG